MLLWPHPLTFLYLNLRLMSRKVDATGLDIEVERRELAHMASNSSRKERDRGSCCKAEVALAKETNRKKTLKPICILVP